MDGILNKLEIKCHKNGKRQRWMKICVIIEEVDNKFKICIERMGGKMDITFQTEEGKFNYRVCAIMIYNEKILAMHDERSPYFYLPGGRVRLQETAEHAVLREIKEELEIEAEIIRPLWLNQSFFVEDVNHEKYHEICIYFLVDISKTNLLEKGERFTLLEGEHTHVFEWLDFERLKSEYIYPLFIKDKIFDLPQNFTILTEYE